MEPSLLASISSDSSDANLEVRPAKVVDTSASASVCLDRCHDLLSEKGDAPGNRIAQELVSRCEALNDTDRVSLLNSLTSEFAVDPALLRRAAEGYLKNPAFAALAALQ